MSDMHDLIQKILSLKLFYLAEHLEDIIARTTKNKMAPLAIVEDLISNEIRELSRRNTEARLAFAKIGKRRPMADFDWNWPQKINRPSIESLFSLQFLEEPANVILLGPAGVGKSMIAKNLTYDAVLAGHQCIVVEAAHMLSELQRQESPRLLQRKINFYAKPKLLVIDELGYLSFNDQASDLLFQIVSKRYEISATIITSNVAFKDWGSIFPSATCVATMLDRLTHKAEIISIEGESYRKKEAAERQAKKHKKNNKDQ